MSCSKEKPQTVGNSCANPPMEPIGGSFDSDAVSAFCCVVVLFHSETATTRSSERGAALRRRRSGNGQDASDDDPSFAGCLSGNAFSLGLSLAGRAWNSAVMGIGQAVKRRPADQTAWAVGGRRCGARPPQERCIRSAARQTSAIVPSKRDKLGCRPLQRQHRSG